MKVQYWKFNSLIIAKLLFFMLLHFFMVSQVTGIKSVPVFRSRIKMGLRPATIASIVYSDLVIDLKTKKVFPWEPWINNKAD